MTNSNDKQPMTNDKRAALMARLLNRQKTPQKKAGITPKTWDGPRRPLSFAQQRVWFLQQMEPANTTWNLTDQLLLEGSYDLALLSSCLHQLLERHEGLRTTFDEQNSETVAIVHESFQVTLQEHDLRGLTKAQQTQQGIDLIDALAAEPFDLSQGPLLRTQVLRLDENQTLWSFCLHHVIYDTWSSAIFLKELEQLVIAAKQGRPAALKPLPIQYADFAAWQRERLSGDAWTRLWDFWRGKLGEQPEPLSLTTDHARPNILPSECHNVAWQLDAETTAAIKALCRQQGCTTFLFVMAAFKALLFRYTTREDLAIGTVIANREQPELAGLIGFFVNTVIYPSQVDGQMRFSDLLKQIKQTHTEVSSHGEMPFEKLVDAYQLPRDLSGNPLVRLMISMDSGVDADISALTEEQAEAQATTRSPFDLVLRIQDGECLRLELEYNLGLFKRPRILRMAKHLETLIQATTKQVDSSLNQLPLLSASEEQQILHDWNQTAHAYPATSHAHGLLEQWALQTPTAPAVVFADQVLSYDALNKRANQLAHLLIERGLKPGTLVGISLERSLEMVVAVWGIFKAGLAYLPLDPSYPADRLAGMIDDSGVSLILSDQDKAPRFPAAVQALAMDQVALADQPEHSPQVEVSPDAMAYVIYTSGSTGKPKGVMGVHRGLCNLHLAQRQVFAIQTDDRILQFASLSFDASLWEMVMALLNGATLVMAARDIVADPNKLHQLMDQQAISVATLPPTMLRVLDENLPALRAVISAGEACRPSLVKRWGQTRAFFNAYGPTETTVCATVHACDPNDSEIPIGRPLINTQVYILDPAGNPTPIGVPGELHVAGAGLALGYLKREQLSQERFPNNPFGAGRIYKTGDLAAYREDGRIDYIGRIDDQVKIRGHRVEPGEIATVLAGHESVTAATVIANDDDTGQLRLAAYLVPKDGAMDVAKIRAWLSQRLPDYMIPAFFMTVTEIPLSPNGKVDRKRLPKPEQQTQVNTYTSPRAGNESILAEIWAEILKLDRVGRNDNFFTLGGDSILSFKVVSRAAKAGITLSVQDMFATKSLAELAARADQGAAAVIAEQGLVSAEATLTPIQNWFFSQGLEKPHHWNQSQILKLQAPLKPSMVADILSYLMQHHDALRLTYPTRDGQHTGHHIKPLQEAPLKHVDLAELSEQASRDAILAEANDMQASFDLSDGPLFKAALFSMAHNSQVLLLVAHHLIMDAMSWRILLEDLETLTTQALAGKALDLGRKTTAFRDYATILWQQDATEEAAYWQAVQQTQAAALPMAAPQTRARLATYAKLELVIPKDVTLALMGPAQRPYRTNLEELVLTGMLHALCQWTGQSQQKIHLERHGRDLSDSRLDLSRTVGWFTTLFPVAFELGNPAAIEDRLKRVKESLRQVPNGGRGYGLHYHTQQAAKPLNQPQISFNFLGNFDDDLDASGFYQPADLPSGQEQSLENHGLHALSVDCWIYQGCLRFHLAYPSSQFETSQMDELGISIQGSFETLVAHTLREDAGGYTPSDFPLAGLDQNALDRLLAKHGEVDAIYPLTPTQEGMLYHARLEEHTTTYFVQPSFEIRGALDVARFERACQQMVAQHDILRTVFVYDDLPRPLQVVLSEPVMDFRHLDLRSSQDIAADLEDFYGRDRNEAFALSTEPPLRMTLILLPEVDHEPCYQFVFSHHHLLLDAWSLPLVLESLSQAYRCDDAIAPAAQKGGYESFIKWLENRDRSEEAAFWRGYLQGMDTPTELILPAITESEATAQTIGSACFELTPQATNALNARARDLRITANVMVQAAWALLLSRYTHKADVLFGMTIAGRPAALAGAETTAGLFINTLPVRLNGKPQTDLATWLKDCDSRIRGVMEHEASALVDIAAWSEMPSRRNLFETIVVFENAPKAEMDAQLPFRITQSRSYEENNYGITVLAIPAERLQLELVYDGQRFPHSIMTRMVGHLGHLLQGLAHGASRDSELDMLAETEKQRLLIDWNQTQTDYPDGDQTLTALLDRCAQANPEAIALIDASVEGEPQQLSYRQLHERANQVALHLIGDGLAIGDPVGVLCERSTALMVSLLGILKAGGFYVPLDPTTPPERLAHMIQESGLRTLLSQCHLQALAESLMPRERILTAETMPRSEAQQPAPNRTIPHNSPAYMIYTSGSTGRPKGVINSHRGIVNRLLWMQASYPIGHGDRVLQKTPITFDVSVWELFWPLLSGASLVISKPGGHQDPSYLAELIEAQGISTLHFVPSMLRAFLASHKDTPCRAPRQVICSGEALSDDLVKAFHHCFKADLHNLYGPTEAAIDVSYQPCPAGMKGAIPIGKPIANTELYITAPDLRPVGQGIPGQLLIGGINLATGYAKRAGLTASRFIPNPFIQEPSDHNRLYCTGDLARYDAAGRIEFMGRLDHQIKLRGFRIELGEIEAALEQHPDIDHNAVLLCGSDDPFLTGFVVGSSDAALHAKELKAFLADKVPSYMVPTHFVVLADMPQTSSGKIDRRALAGMSSSDHLASKQAYRAASNDLEGQLLAIWHEVLGLSPEDAASIGIDHDFFEVGGHSLTATRAVTRIAEQFGHKLPVARIFENPSVASMAELISALRFTTPTHAPQTTVSEEDFEFEEI